MSVSDKVVPNEYFIELGIYWLSMGEQPDDEHEERTSMHDQRLKTSLDFGPSVTDAFQRTPKDRPRGILSTTDREYLFGNKEYAQPQTDANRRQDIRKRVVNALEDFRVLFSQLPDKERSKIFESMQDETTLEGRLSAVIAFCYLGLDCDQSQFQSCLERGVLRAENHGKEISADSRATHVDISLDIEYDPNIERLLTRLEEGDRLTNAEIGALVRAGALGGDQIEQLEDKRMQLVDFATKFDVAEE
jgi:hypothetical protein